MWHEKLVTDNKRWVNRPENIRGAIVKDNTTFQQLQQLAKTCNCELAKAGLQEMLENKLCKEHFATPFSDLFKDMATPPDFMTSFSNLALGSLFQTNIPTKNNGLYKAEAEIWQSGNHDFKILIHKLKSSVIIFPAKLLKASTNVNTRNKTDNIARGLLEVLNSSRSNELLLKYKMFINVTSDNNTFVSNGDPEFRRDIGGNVHNKTRRFVSKRSLDSNKNESFRTANKDFRESAQPTNESNTQTPTTLTSPATPEQVTAATVINSPTTTKPETAPTTVALATTAQPETTLTTVALATTAQPETTLTTVALATKAQPTTAATKITLATTAQPEIALTTVALATTAQPTIAATTITLATTTQPTNTNAISTEVSVKPDDESITSDHDHVNQVVNSESYYAIRRYLDAVLPIGNEEVILIPSLISDAINSTDNGTRGMYTDRNIWHNGKLYHAYNSVNLLTTATTTHALVLASLSGLIDIGTDTMLQRIVLSSLRLLTWYMNNTQEFVTMVTLSEFPSRYQVYWATSRIAFQLNSKQAEATKMFQFADEETKVFVKTLREKMTFSILQSIIDDGLGQDGKTRVYIDDFIGTADVDDKGKKLAGGDDRLFSSAMAINALIATWTVQADSRVLQFVSEITDPVRIAVNSLANYVIGVVVKSSGQDQNAFMSEQIKNCKTLPVWFPANIITTADGKEVNPSEPTVDLRLGVNNYIPQDDYQKILEKPTFGYSPRNVGLEDLKSPTSVFRYWSSPAYTKAAALLAIAQAANLQADAN